MRSSGLGAPLVPFSLAVDAMLDAVRMAKKETGQRLFGCEIYGSEFTGLPKAKVKWVASGAT